MAGRLVSVMVCAAIAAGCVGGDRAARRFLERGDAQLAAGHDAAAAIEYRNAIKQRPAWAEAYRKLGDAYMEAGDSEEAYRAYASAIELEALWNGLAQQVPMNRLCGYCSAHFVSPASHPVLSRICRAHTGIHPDEQDQLGSWLVSPATQLTVSS